MSENSRSLRVAGKAWHMADENLGTQAFLMIIMILPTLCVKRNSYDQAVDKHNILEEIYGGNWVIEVHK